jgi:hypothetical protein
MTARTLLCDTLSNSTETDESARLDIRVIMGGWRSVAGVRWVYFADRDGLVKIGYSADPHRRVDQLGARLLAVMPGGSVMERLMHRRFAEYRSHGEWFHPGLGLITFIEALHGDDPYRRVDLPREYSRAEVDRHLAAERAHAAQAEMVRAAWELTVADERSTAGFWPPLIPGDREAAELIGRALASTLSVAS